MSPSSSPVPSRLRPPPPPPPPGGVSGPPTASASRRRMPALAVFVTVLWSTSWVLIRTGLDEADLPPLTFAGLRYGLAAVALYVWVAVRRRGRGRAAGPILASGHVRVVVALGLVQFAVTQGAQFVAIDNQPAATTSLLLATTPLVVALSSGFIGERPTMRQVTAGLVIGAGAAVYFAGELGATPLGLTAALVGLAGNAGAVLLGRAINRSGALDVTGLTMASMTTGAVAMLVVGVGLDGLPRLSLLAVAIVAWLAVVNTAAAFTWWNVCLRHLPASQVAAINSTMVVQIPLLAWVFLDEPLGVAEGLGLTIVAVGVVVAAAAATTTTTTTSRR